MRDLYAIHTTSSVPQSGMYQVDVAAADRRPLSFLGSRFRGGLTYRPKTRLFYGLSDGVAGGPPSLASISGEGAAQIVAPLNASFHGGLAYHPGDDALFTIKNVNHPHLARIHKLGFDGSHHELFQLDQLTFGGLVYERLRDRFFAIGTAPDGLSWLVWFNLQGQVQRLFAIGRQATGGLAYAMHEDRFYFVAEDPDGSGVLHRLSLSGQVQRVASLGLGFSVAGLCATPWFGGTLNVKAPLWDERFVLNEPVRLEAEVLDPTGRPVWDSAGVSWRGNYEGPLGTGALTTRLRSPGAQTITAELHGLSRTVPTRVFSDLWELYKSVPAQAEVQRVLTDFAIHWVDGSATDPTQQWATYPGYPFDQASADPSRMAVIAKLDILRHQRFASPLPFSGAGESLYEFVRQRSPVIRVSLAGALNQAGGGTIFFNRPFAQWSGMLPYVHNLYLLVHENRHNDAGDPLHTSCTGWDGSTNPPNGADATFEPGSGYAAAARYLMWIYRYSLYDPPSIKTEARSVAISLKGRICAHPSSSDPRVQALLVELWSA